MDYGSRGRARFTLVELAIVVCIIAVVAGLAVPLVLDARARARAAEAVVNLTALETAFEAYAAELPPGTDVGDDAAHGSTLWFPGTELHPFQGNGALAAMAWAPDGEVRCAYNVAAMSLGPAPAVYSYALCDVDGDAHLYQVNLQRLSPEGSTERTVSCSYFRGAMDHELTQDELCTCDGMHADMAHGVFPGVRPDDWNVQDANCATGEIAQSCSTTSGSVENYCP